MSASAPCSLAPVPRRVPVHAGRVGALLLLGLFLFLPVGVEAQSGRGSGANGTDEAGDSGDPVPYDPSEFSPGLRQIYRGVVVFTGSVPVTTLYARLGFVAGRFAVQSIRDGSPALQTIPALAPPGSDPDAALIDQEDTRVILFSALGASFAIALLDWILVRAGR